MAHTFAVPDRGTCLLSVTTVRRRYRGTVGFWDLGILAQSLAYGAQNPNGGGLPSGAAIAGGPERVGFYHFIKLSTTADVTKEQGGGRTASLPGGHSGSLALPRVEEGQQRQNQRAAAAQMPEHEASAGTAPVRQVLVSTGQRTLIETRKP